MASLIRLPQLGANIVEGVVGLWRKREGEAVAAGEPIVEIVTSKATFDVDSPADGILRRRLAPEKSAVPVGYVLGIVASAEEPLPEVAAENERLVTAFRAQAAAATGGATSSPVKATPGARRVAREAGLDLSAVPLPPGRDVLREEDVRAFLSKQGA